MWGAWAKYCYRVDVGRFAWFAQKVWDVDCEDGEKAALEGIDKTICFFQSLGMPVSMNDLGIGILSAPIIAELADSCVFHGKRLVGNFRPLHKQDIIAIYHMANF